MRYATKKEVKELRECVVELSKRMSEMARWQAFYAIKKNPNVFDVKQREEILELAKGTITYPLLLKLFKEYPLR